MTPRATRWSCLLVLLGGACATSSDPDEGSPFVTNGVPPAHDEASDEASDDAADHEESGTSTTSDAGTAAAAEGDAPSTGTTGEPLDPEDTGGGSTDATPADGGAGVCNPAASDAPCTACSKTNCCAQLSACSSDPGCNCYMLCVHGSGDVFGCGTECGVDLFAPGPVGDLVSCSGAACSGSCV